MAKLYFYYSAMNAGKSTTLLQSSYNYNERGMGTVLFAPKLDDRIQAGLIASRIGLSANAFAFTNEHNLFDEARVMIAKTANTRCVLVDEAQFLSQQQVLQLCQIVDDLRLPVLAYGLRTDFLGNLFPGSLHLLAWADELIELKTICHCGSKATMNMRVDSEGNKVEEGNQVEIGGNDRYVSTCRKHFLTGVSGISVEKEKAATFS